MSFLPISVLFQFRKLSNIYFLATAVIMLIPEISPLNPASAIGPLVFVVAVSEIREALEEMGAARRDKKANSALVDKVTSRTPTRDLRPGDIIVVRKDDAFPADLVLLQSSTQDGSAFVETANLDGETNLKVRRGPSMTTTVNIPELYGFRLACEAPSADMYSFKGVIDSKSGDESEALTINNMLLRGCTLRNTDWVVGVVVYTGHDCKVMLNAKSGLTPSKVTGVDTQMNRNVISLFVIQLIMCLIASLIGYGSESAWYLDGLSTRWLALFLTYFILLNTIIPASLWVSVEILKFMQSWFLEADPSVSIKCNAKNIHEELGRITHVFSDKTGTLTLNKMKFVGANVMGKLYILPPEEESPVITAPVLPYPGVLAPNPQLTKILSDTASGDPESNEAKLLLCMALCHTCERVKKPITGEESNQSSSPDEAALVQSAAECEVIFTGRPDPTKISVSAWGSAEEWELLHNVAFTSERRMMTVVSKSVATGVITVWTKGADSSVIPKCSTGPIDETKQAVSSFSHFGFRTLCLAHKILDLTSWDQISHRLQVARAKEATGEDSHGRLRKEIESEIESDLELIGSTAVEDRLQDGVPETLRALKAAGIKVCMITGDKRETAINIARACGLISTKRSVFTMLSHSNLFGGGHFVPLRCLEDIVRELQDPTSESDPFANDIWSLATARMGIDTSRRRPDSGGNTLAPPMLSREVTRPDCPAVVKGQFSMVIDGASLSQILASESSRQQLVDVLSFEQCEAVVFCRVSPKQKGEIVRLVQHHLTSKGKSRKSTLAIGDGANDINMINIANVGVGIAGNEGAQAANSADYAISEFKDLYKLLFVHGRRNFLRTTKFINLFMYKNFLFTLCQFWFSTISLFSGQTVFDDGYVLLFNSVFCFVPLFLMGLIDKEVDVDKDAAHTVAMRGIVYWREVVFPRIYRFCTPKFTEWSVLKWCLVGSIQSIIVFYGAYGPWGYVDSPLPGQEGKPPTFWMASILAYTSMIFVVSFVNMQQTQDWTKAFLWSIMLFNFVLYFGFVLAYDRLYFRTNDFVGGMAVGTLGNFSFWLMVVWSCVVAMGSMVSVSKYLEWLFPKWWLGIAGIIRYQRSFERIPKKSDRELQP